MINSQTKSTKVAPLALFTYNRLDVLKNTIDCLKDNDLIQDTDLYIYSDGPKLNDSEDLQKVDEVRNYLKNIQINVKSIHIHEHDKNLGLANSIIWGLNQLSIKFDRFIVLEDDLIVSKYFLNYMNEALKKFEVNLNVWSINGMGLNKDYFSVDKDYIYNTYFSFRPSSHGWATWSNRWNKSVWNEKEIKKALFNFRTLEKFSRGGNDLTKMILSQITRKIDSWAIRWSFSISKHDGVCLSPIHSHVSAQVDSGGTHIRTYIPLIDNDINLAQKNSTYPENFEVLDSIEIDLYKIFSNSNNHKIQKSKGIFIKFYEYLNFWTNYIILKFDIKSKKHKFLGYLESLIKN